MKRITYTQRIPFAFSGNPNIQIDHTRKDNVSALGELVIPHKGGTPKYNIAHLVGILRHLSAEGEEYVRFDEPPGCLVISATESKRIGMLAPAHEVTE